MANNPDTLPPLRSGFEIVQTHFAQQFAVDIPFNTSDEHVLPVLNADTSDDNVYIVCRKDLP